MYDPHSPYQPHHPPPTQHFGGGAYYPQSLPRPPPSYPHSGGPSSSPGYSPHPHPPSFPGYVPSLFGGGTGSVPSSDFSPPHSSSSGPSTASSSKASLSSGYTHHPHPSTLQAMADAAALTASNLKGRGSRSRSSKSKQPPPADDEEGGGRRSQSSKKAKSGSGRQSGGAKSRSAKPSGKAKKAAKGRRGKAAAEPDEDDEAGDDDNDGAASDADEGSASDAESEASSQLSASEHLAAPPQEEGVPSQPVNAASPSFVPGEAPRAPEPVPMTKASLTQAFSGLFSLLQSPQGATASALRTFTIARRKMFKQQLGYVVANPEALLALLLHRAKATFKALDKDEDKVEREMLVALFGGVLGKGPTQRMLNIAGWAVGRVMSLTKEGEEIAPSVKESKRRAAKTGKSAVDPSSSSSPNGPASDLPAQLIRQRNRICKSTGRSMHEEREIALKYFSLPQFANADIMTIYLQYQFDTTGGDLTKHPPLSRAHFYSVAPEEKKRKRKAEVHRVDCTFCHKPIRIKVDEVEEPGPPIKKRKVKKEKKAAKPGTAAAAAPGEGAEGQPAQAASEEGKEEAQAESKEEKMDGKEEKEEKKEGADDGETVPGPMVRRIKLEVVTTPDDALSNTPKQPRMKRKRGEGAAAQPATAAAADGTTPKKRRGRPKKERPQLTLTQEMLPLLPPSIQPHLAASQQLLQANRSQAGGGEGTQSSSPAPVAGSAAEGAPQTGDAGAVPRAQP